MFTINIYLKFALIALLLIEGTVLAFLFGFWYAFPLIIIGLGLVASYIFLGTVQSAAVLMEQMDFERTERRLSLTIKPNWLYKTNRAYFYLIKGNVAANTKDMVAAEQHFLMAQKLELPSDNEKAMVCLQLSNIAASKGNWQGAQLEFRKVQKMKITDPNLRDQIKQFDKSFKQRGTMKASQMGRKGQFYAGGGKRRRPKSR